MSKPDVRLDRNDAAVLLVDHQTGLLSLVRDIDPDKFKNNVLALADCAQYFELPTILTTSFEQGPNGPLVPELKEKFSGSPYIARPGQINAWDRMSVADVQMMTWFGLACELHRDWRNDVEGLGNLFSKHIPDYRNLMNSYSALQSEQ